jgi:heptaprenyl diphosphate synthase
MRVGARSRSGRLATLGLLLAAGLALYVVESALPAPFPFLRLGLANVATIVAILMLGMADALALTVLRVSLASILVGTFLGPAFALAMAGGVAATIAMGLAARWALPPLGVVGVSLLGALTHNVAQLCVIGGIYTGRGPAVSLLPAALFVSAAAGLGTGLIARFTTDRLGAAVAGGVRAG